MTTMVFKPVRAKFVGFGGSVTKPGLAELNRGAGQDTLFCPVTFLNTPQIQASGFGRQALGSRLELGSPL